MTDYDQILPGNPHPGRAERALRVWDLANDGGEDRPDLLHRSQTEATLALAYEQRTANLIALAQLCVSIDGPTVDLSDDLQQITERLGMRAEK